MLSKTELEYAYVPSRYFESEMTFAIQGGVLRIDEGRAVVTLAEPRALTAGDLLAFTEAVRNVFLARQVLAHSRFKLDGPSIVQQSSDGRRDVTLHVHSPRVEVRANLPDIRVTDPDGRVVVDTRTQRLAEHQAFITLLAPRLPSSATLRRMLQGYCAAVDEPANEMVHLYELRDAVATHYGSANAAQASLGISAAEWNGLGRLANTVPIFEGRHRGRHIQPLRPATDEERALARQIARRILERFAATVQL